MGNFNLSLTLAAPPSGSANVLHVWGITRGGGTPRLNLLSDPDLDPSVRWDSLAALFGEGMLRLVTFPQAGAPTITSIAVGAAAARAHRPRMNALTSRLSFDRSSSRTYIMWPD